MCLNPMHGFRVGKNPNGKADMKICGREVVAIEKVGGNWRKYVDLSYVQHPLNAITQYIDIPCGQCIECRLAYSRDWATRMMLEAQYHDSSYFLTLTYDDAHVPLSAYGDPETGEAIPSLTLQKKDMQGFIKRLRRRLEYDGKPQIRFYGCGEYGSETHRPHYHIVVFGLELDDLELLKKSDMGFPYYRSQLIEECWTYGYSMVCNVSWDTCAYVARYVTKKWTGDYKEFYEQFNILPEFALMSRKPGIAKQYFDEHKEDIYRFDELYLKMSDGGKTTKPPRYYDRLFDVENPEIMQTIKQARKDKSEKMDKIRQRNTTLSKDEQLQARKELMIKRYNMLPRKEI